MSKHLCVTNSSSDATFWIDEKTIMRDIGKNIRDLRIQNGMS